MCPTGDAMLEESSDNSVVSTLYQILEGGNSINQKIIRRSLARFIRSLPKGGGFRYA